MLQQSDIQGRLRLLRYGLVVVVVVTFMVSLLAPYASVRNVAGTPITDFLGTALLFTVIVAVVAIIVYFVYHYFLTKTWPFGLGGKRGASS